MFQPVVPLSGYAGWTFLQRSRDTQQAAFDASPRIARDTAYFEEKIAEIRTADDLVADRRLLRVALGAFGLDADAGSRFFVRKVLAEGSVDPGALANRLSDKRYLAFASAFGFGDLDPPNTALSDFGAGVVEAYRDRQFEIAVGKQEPDLRLAMGLERDLSYILKRQTTDDGYWFSVMGNPPLRKVFETALGLPGSFGGLDLDRQLEGFRQAAQRVFGTTEVAGFEAPEVQERLVRVFLLRSEIASGADTSAGQAALTLLQSAPVRYPRLL